MCPEADRTIVHVICTCHGQWLPGDARGWRSRDHRVHSSGDYKNPPPELEHEGLRRHARQSMKIAPVRLSPHQLEPVGSAFVEKLDRLRCDLYALAVSPTHTHGLVAVPDEQRSIEAIKKLIGRAKQFASLRCPHRSGTLWAEGCGVKYISDQSHFENTRAYILRHDEFEGAWMWVRSTHDET